MNDYEWYSNYKYPTMCIMLLYLTSVGSSICAPRVRRVLTIFSLPLRLATNRGDCLPCRVRTVECHMSSKNDEAIHMIAWDVTMHCMLTLQCCTLLISAPLFSNSSTNPVWPCWHARYSAVLPCCIRETSRVRQIQHPLPLHVQMHKDG